MRLLLIDDDTSYRRSLQRVLQTACPHWQCQSSESTLKAKELLQDTEFDVILCDLEMPDGNGDLFLQSLSETSPQTIRILHSGNLERGKEVAEQDCCHKFIPKPTGARELVSLLRDFEEILYLDESPAIQNLLLKAPALPREPSLALEIDSLLASEDFHQTHIVQLLSRDPVVTALLLRAAQNVAFSAAAPVTSLNQAILKLGMSSVRNLVLGAELFSRISSDLRTQESLARIWDHSLEVAELSRAFSATRGACSQLQDSVFTVGILHDIGMLLLLEADPEHYLPLLESGTESDILLFERETYGIDHARIGAMLVKRWSLSPEIASAIALHHTPQTVCTNGFSAAAVQLVENSLTEAAGLSREQRLEQIQAAATSYYGTSQ